MQPFNRMAAFRSQSAMSAPGAGTSMGTFSNQPMGAGVSANVSAGGDASAQATGMLVVLLGILVVLAHFGLK